MGKSKEVTGNRAGKGKSVSRVECELSELECWPRYSSRSNANKGYVLLLLSSGGSNVQARGAFAFAFAFALRRCGEISCLRREARGWVAWVGWGETTRGINENAG